MQTSPAHVPPYFYVTGTDTGVGKSLVSAALLHALRARGVRAVGMKPVASGCERTADGWRNEDALLLQAASDPRPVYGDINPYALRAPVAPELALRDDGVELSLAALVAAYARLAAQAERVVVEGVGGWMAPLSDTLDQLDLVRALRLPVVLVVGLRLGCINHARLTVRALQADGVQLAGWVANEVDPAMARIDDNVAILRDRLPAPCWGRLPHAATPDPALLARHLVLPD
ncbi:dethiobiotin synthetase [Lysobacter arseniciresistens ZS79]|uniref:ATP-dependent dethiobiotin synthetase BioD n=1 Tax=Lysobacter arseniciresistens ZS79 TaxID=913325 RepID=A0A0A0F3G5_9GAMM|nr:dethiobiotin synthase [Lysobacter arseniciresistens]KGM56848.1 dethiobiotin synthetase [Lysobacter arseniciresistens ZS79]